MQTTTRVVITLGITSAALFLLKKIYSWHKQNQDMVEVRKLYMLQDFSIVAKLQQIIDNDPMNFEARMLLFGVTDTLVPLHKYANSDAERQVSLIGFSTPEREYLAISQEFSTNYMIQHYVLQFAFHFDKKKVMEVVAKRLLDCAPNKEFESIAWYYMYVSATDNEQALKYANKAVACAEQNNRAQVAAIDYNQDKLDKFLAQHPQCFRAIVATCHNLIDAKKFDEALQRIAPYANLSTGLLVISRAYQLSLQYEKMLITIDTALSKGIGNVGDLVNRKTRALMRMGRFDAAIALAEEYPVKRAIKNRNYAIRLQKYAKYFDKLETLQFNSTTSNFSLALAAEPAWHDILLVAIHVYFLNNPSLVSTYGRCMKSLMHSVIPVQLHALLSCNAAIAYDFLRRMDKKLPVSAILPQLEDCKDPIAKYLAEGGLSK